jgi:redox-sensitive bicupin YhaK (pirin superfamily)
MKKSNTSIEGKNVMVGELLVNRLIPTVDSANVGPFLLLDHGYPVNYKKDLQFTPALNEHPHRGLVAFTYVIEGEVEHVDSMGNHAFAADGGAHWLSSGKGILHGERVSARTVGSGGTLQVLQFWTNIPSPHKGDTPQYRTLNAGDFPSAPLPDHAGSIRVLLGKCGAIESGVESLSQAFLYRVSLNAKSEFSMPIREQIRSAVFVPGDTVIVNGEAIGNSQLMIMENNTGQIVLRNPGISNADAYVLGGPEPDEPFFVQGPFVMNSREEIANAYQDFFEGEYGVIQKLQKV